MEITEKNNGEYLGYIDGESAIFINEKNYQNKFSKDFNKQINEIKNKNIRNSLSSLLDVIKNA